MKTKTTTLGVMLNGRTHLITLSRSQEVAMRRLAGIPIPAEYGTMPKTRQAILTSLNRRGLRNVVVVRHDELNRSKRITLTELGEAWATAQRKRDRVLAEAVAAAEAELAPARARIAAAQAAYEVDAIRERLDRARQAEDFTQTDEYEAAVKAAQAAGLFPLRAVDIARGNCPCPTVPAPEIRGDDADTLTDHDPACLVLADLEA